LRSFLAFLFGRQVTAHGLFLRKPWVKLGGCGQTDHNLLVRLTMTRAVGRHEREIANGPAPSFHSHARSNTSISLLASSINFRSAISASRSCRADRTASYEN
jgi:hypothetical protein